MRSYVSAVDATGVQKLSNAIIIIRKSWLMSHLGHGSVHLDRCHTCDFVARQSRIEQSSAVLYSENESRDCATRHGSTCDTPCHTCDFVAGVTSVLRVRWITCLTKCDPLSDLYFAVLVKILAGKNISNMTCFMSSGM